MLPNNENVRMKKPKLSNEKKLVFDKCKLCLYGA